MDRKPVKAQRVSIFGDVCLGERFRDIKIPSEFDSDLLVGNLEGVFRLGAEPAQKAGPHVWQSSQFIESRVFKSTIWSLSNNHTLDFGVECAQSTAERLSNSYSGFGLPELVQKSWQKILLGDRQVSIVFVTEFSPEIKTNLSISTDGRWLDELVATLAKNSFPIIFYHGGLEGTPIPSTQQVERARKLVEIGAKAVLFSHSHVLGHIERYCGAVIDYGMGNFAVDPKTWNPYHEFALHSRVHTISLTEKGELEISSEVVKIKNDSSLDSVIEIETIKDASEAKSLENYQAWLMDTVQDAPKHQVALNYVARAYWNHLGLRNLLLGALLETISRHFGGILRKIPRMDLFLPFGRRLLFDLLAQPSNFIQLRNFISDPQVPGDSSPSTSAQNLEALLVPKRMRNL